MRMPFLYQYRILTEKCTCNRRMRPVRGVVDKRDGCHHVSFWYRHIGIAVAVGLPIQNVPHTNQRATSNQLSPIVPVPQERSCSDIKRSPTYDHQRPARSARVGHLCFLLKPYKFMALLLRDYNTSFIQYSRLH